VFAVKINLGLPVYQGDFARDRLAGLAQTVDDLYVWSKPDVVTLLSGPQAQIGVFEIEFKVFIESIDFVQEVSSNHHAGSGHDLYVHFPALNTVNDIVYQF
jgi:hypothetical protein